MRHSPFRAATLSLLLAVGCTVAGCDGPHEGDVKIVVIGDEPPRLANPADGPLSAPEAVLLANSAQGLVRFDGQGHIVPGLAERWNVTDDGLSYIFRLASTEWPNGEKVTARQVARMLRRQVAGSSRNALKDTLGAIDEIVAMTDRVIEIRLTAPRPHLLQILAQPELALVRDGGGTGPFRIAEAGEGEGEDEEPAEGGDGTVQLVRTVTNAEEEVVARDEVVLGSAEAPVAVQQFLSGEADLVLGGTFADLPYARAVDLPRDALRFDPASGLFGLAPARDEGPIADPELRSLLSRAIDRQALIDALNVPGLLPRATLLEPGLAGVEDPVPPDWAATPAAQRREALAAAADAFFGDEERPTLRIALPDGPGSQLVLNRLAADWSVLGIRVERAGDGEPADLVLIDRLAPSDSPGWFLRQFRCAEAAVCDEEADEALEAARAAPVSAQRAAFLAEAARLMDEAQLFIPIAAPIRWALVSERMQGFAGNRFARHPLTALGERLRREE